MTQQAGCYGYTPTEHNGISEQVADRTKELAAEALDRADDWLKPTGLSIKERPMTVLAVIGGLAFAAGALWMMRSSKQQSRYDALVGECFRICLVELVGASASPDHCRACVEIQRSATAVVSPESRCMPRKMPGMSSRPCSTVRPQSNALWRGSSGGSRASQSPNCHSARLIATEPMSAISIAALIRRTSRTWFIEPTDPASQAEGRTLPVQAFSRRMTQGLNGTVTILSSSR